MDLTATFWSEEEYALVAEGLLWPASRKQLVVCGWSTPYETTRVLDLKLQQLSVFSKARILELARTVRALVDQRLRQGLGGAGACGGGSMAIVRVGDITFDRQQPIAILDKSLAEARAMLSRAVDFPINPEASPAPGGINGRCVG